MAVKIKNEKANNAQAERDALASITFGQAGPIEALWCDGGVIYTNASPFGGTYAWCGVNAAGEIIKHGFAVVPAPDGREVTNNDTEIIAVIQAMRSVPDGWSGTIYTDSMVTITRFQNIRNDLLHRITKIPKNVLAEAINQMGRMGKVAFKLVKGHPDAASLEIGVYEYDLVRQKANPRVVSRFNVWCDAKCGTLAKGWIEEHGFTKESLAAEVKRRREVPELRECVPSAG